MLRLLIFLFISIFIFCSCCFAAKEKDQQMSFSQEESEQVMSKINGALSDYRNLFNLLLNSSSELSEQQKLAFYINRLPKDQKLTFSVSSNDLKNIQSLDWDMQNIGFSNWAKYIEGYIAFQQLELLKKDLEIKRLKNETGTEALQEKIRSLQKSLKDKYSSEHSFID